MTINQSINQINDSLTQNRLSDDYDHLDDGALALVAAYEARHKVVASLLDPPATSSAKAVRFTRVASADDVTSRLLSDVLLAAVSLNTARLAAERHRSYLNPRLEYQVDVRSGDADAPARDRAEAAALDEDDRVCAFDIDVVIDPLSRTAARFGPLLRTLARSAGEETTNDVLLGSFFFFFS